MTVRAHAMHRTPLWAVMAVKAVKATALLLASAALPAAAATLIDTGLPNGSKPAGTVDSSKFLAVEFTTYQPWAIDGPTAFAAGSDYQAYPGLQFGLQVSGAVPEPASVALLLAGLALLGALLATGAGRRPAGSRQVRCWRRHGR